MRKREQRMAIRARARLKQGGGWSDVVVRNVSRRGLMLEASTPPACGTFVELRRGSSIVIGQVRWVQDNRCGLLVQDRIDPRIFLAARDGSDPWRPGDADRRALARPGTTQNLARSQAAARAGQWLGVTLVTLVGAYVIVSAAHSALARPIAQVAQVLAAPSR
ncbi:PilZ domain-containing protein [Sphingomonas sp. PAMC 26605]|uniref:PilZ domain-containing protein n=1 Tax=Sphingomonas sp. PAMC 26605 TaxID=1112214 RepID=UPI0002F92D88|nr:PilZ domain-containing protein [Sphingomonas sp. PAMC 26605]